MIDTKLSALVSQLSVDVRFTALALNLLPGIHRWKKRLVHQHSFMAHEQSALLLKKQLAGKKVLETEF